MFGSCTKICGSGRPMNMKMNLILLAFGVIVWSGAWGCVDRPEKETNEPPATTIRRERSEDKKISTTRPSEKGWILGTYHDHPNQRRTIDDGLSALLQDQHVGSVPFVFVSQRNYHQDMGKPSFMGGFPPRYPRPPISIDQGAMILLKGQFVTEDLWTLPNSSRALSELP